MTQGREPRSSGELEERFPEERDPDARPERRLIERLGRVSRRLGPAGDLVVLVDSLDETHAEPGEPSGWDEPPCAAIT